MKTRPLGTLDIVVALNSYCTSSELFILSQGATNYIVKYFATGMEEFLPFGEQVGDRVLLTDTSASLTLDVPFVLYGVPHTELFVSTQSCNHVY